MLGTVLQRESALEIGQQPRREFVFDALLEDLPDVVRGHVEVLLDLTDLYLGILLLHLLVALAEVV